MRPSKSWLINVSIDTRPVFCAVLSIWLLLSGTDKIHAKDLGRVGPVYPIIEMSASERARQQPHVVKDQPTHTGFPLTVAREEHYLDLSYTVPESITDEKGNVLYPKGYRFNPLEHRRFRTMIVIDGSDEKQLDWTKTVEGVDDPMTRIVITKGNKTEISKRFKRRVYRLHAQVAQRYRIASVPTIIQQKGATLAVTAIPVH